jgi:hypothetical protein
MQCSLAAMQGMMTNRLQQEYALHAAFSCWILLGDSTCRPGSCLVSVSLREMLKYRLQLTDAPALQSGIRHRAASYVCLVNYMH